MLRACCLVFCLTPLQPVLACDLTASLSSLYSYDTDDAYLAEVAGCLDEDPEAVSRLDQFGTSPLSTAISLGSLGAVKLLLEHGADPDQPDESGDRPLHLVGFAGVAGPEGYVEFAELLIKHGASVNSTNADGQTPLHIAAGFRHGEALVRLLLKAGADPLAPDNKGRPPVFSAVQGDCHVGPGMALVEAHGELKLAGLNGKLVKDGAEILCSGSPEEISFRDALLGQ